MELLIIGALLVYIIYLHFQLYRKNIFINSTVNRLAEIEKTWSKEHLLNLLNELQHFTSFEHIKENKLLADKTLNFIFDGEEKCVIFIHYTKDENIAKRIVGEGFQFVESFYKTAERVTRDKLDLIYKHSLHKHYGRYIIVIIISKKVYNYYTQELLKIKAKNIQVEQILTERQPFLNENLDHIFTLPSQFIKGYVNYDSGEIFQNPDFNPNYNPSRFQKNIDVFF